MKKSKILIPVIAVLVAVLWFGLKHSKHDPDVVIIGIIQTASHPALDRARESFIADLRATLTGVQIKYQNAEGIVSQAQTIAASFHANPSIRAIYAIGTPAAQAIVSVESEKPIVYAAVSDPVRAGLLLRPNVAGVSDKVPAQKQIALIKEMLPNARRIALLYNPSEANSVSAVEEITRAAASMKLEVALVGVTHAGEVITATKRATNADAILVPTDNLLVSAMSTVARLAREHKVPLFVSDPPSVERGALACLGVDYEKAGRDASTVLQKILEQSVKPHDLAVITQEDPPLYLNKSTLIALGIAVSEGILARAKVVP